LTARIEAAGDSSNLVGSSEVSMSGKAAAFGGRMLGAVADQVLKQFADNFAAQLASRAAQPAAAASKQDAPPPAPGEPGPASSGSPSSRPRELNGLALMWAVFKNWLRRLFGKISGKSAA
jgi:uncharacterized protein